MAAYMNRTISMVTGNGTGFDANALTDSTRNLQSVYASQPLQIFVNAKKKINDIFGEIEEYVVDTNTFFGALVPNGEIVDKAEVEEFQNYRLKVAGIREVLERNQMKVAFFGRTSNGKSSVINAMLGDKILPSGIGHTTNCFCSVEGCDGEPYMILENSDEKMNVTNVKQMANALCEEKLSESSLVRVFWPRQRCSLLRDEVVLIDSPGFDITKNLDDWISNHCLNADVFVFVLNAESTMSKAEKQFFHEVAKCLSKPNIFVLNNRWDAAASEPEMQNSVRFQHQERCIDFLTKELKVSSLNEAKERVFFISARETLQARLQVAAGHDAATGALAEGFQARYFEFKEFERKFEECISKSAVKTKFEQHSSGGKEIAKNMYDMLNNILDRTSDIRNKQMAQKDVLTKLIAQTEKELMAVTKEMKAKINRMVEEVEQKVSKALNEEIWRLNVLVDEFSLSFHTEPLVLNVYKKEINSYVETGLGSKLRNRLSTALAMNIETAQKEMQDRMSALVPQDNIKLVQTNKILTRSKPFEMLYSLNCQNLCADFKEDLEFHFSWGITAMIQRFTGKNKSFRSKNSIEDDRTKPTQSIASIPPIISPTTPSGNPNMCLSIIPSTGITQDQLSVISRVAMASVGSQGTVGGLVVAGLLLKSIGWRVLVGVGVLYGSVYLYERLSWTNSAKERTFKSQYVQHATRKLKMIVDLTSANCSHQVQQELSNTFACLCRVIDESSTDMNERLKETETSLRILESHQSDLKVLRNRAKYIASELDIFEKNYINSN